MVDITLVNEASNLLEELGYQMSRSEVFQYLLSEGFIDKFGKPTKRAIDDGWVRDVEEDLDMSFEEFLSHYPVFECFDPSYFKKIDGYWEASGELVDLLEELDKKGELDAFDNYELKYFFATRKIVE